MPDQETMKKNHTDFHRHKTAKNVRLKNAKINPQAENATRPAFEIGNNCDAGPAVTDKYAPLSLGMPHKSGIDNNARDRKTSQIDYDTLKQNDVGSWSAVTM